MIMSETYTQTDLTLALGNVFQSVQTTETPTGHVYSRQLFLRHDVENVELVAVLYAVVYLFIIWVSPNALCSHIDESFWW